MPEYKVDFHSHTTNSSDGRSSLEAMVRSAKKKGMDAILISDHNVFSLEKTQMMEGVLVLSGCEISTTSGHILALFCNPFQIYELRTQEKIPSAQKAITAIHEHGGLAVIAHPFQNPKRNLDELGEMLDGVECANARVYMKNANGNEMAQAFALKHGLFQTGGSDAHHESEVANCYTIVEAPSLNQLEEAIRQGKTRAVEINRTKRTAKGLSQMTSAWRSRKAKKILKASLVLAKGILLDFVGV